MHTMYVYTNYYINIIMSCREMILTLTYKLNSSWKNIQKCDIMLNSTAPREKVHVGQRLWRPS